MNSAGERPSREAVLDAFAVENTPDRPTLERYLLLYPEYAADLVDLSRELSREPYEDTSPLSSADQALIDAAWSRHAAAPGTASDPFAALTVDDMRTVSQRLNVPRQVVTALRERRVALASIPAQVLQILADAMRSSVAQLEAFWGLGQVAAVRSYKADGKPTVGEQVTFEQVLIDAGVSVEDRNRLLGRPD